MFALPIDDLWLLVAMLIFGACAWFVGRRCIWGRNTLFAVAFLLLAAPLYGQSSSGTFAGNTSPTGTYCVIQWQQGSGLAGSASLTNVGASVGKDFQIFPARPDGSIPDYWVLWYGVVATNFSADFTTYPANEMTAQVPLTLNASGVYSGSVTIGKHLIVSSVSPITGAPLTGSFSQTSTLVIAYAPGSSSIKVTGPDGVSTVYFTAYIEGIIAVPPLQFVGADDGNTSPSSYLGSDYNTTTGAFTAATWTPTAPVQYLPGGVTLYISNVTTAPTTQSSTQPTTGPIFFRGISDFLGVGAGVGSSEDGRTNSEGWDDSTWFGHFMNHKQDYNPGWFPAGTFQAAVVPLNAADALTKYEQWFESNYVPFNPGGDSIPTSNVKLGETPWLAYLFGGIDYVTTGHASVGAVTLSGFPLLAGMNWLRGMIDIAFVWVTFKAFIARVLTAMGMTDNVNVLPLDLPGEENV